MSLMWKRWLVLACTALVLLTSACSASAGLRVFSDARGDFSFGYPNGMTVTPPGALKERVVLLRDLVHESENVSLMVSPFDRVATISELGSPTEVGERVAQKIIAPPDSGRTTELLKAGSMQQGEQQYYILEYQTRLGSQSRHEVVNVTVQHHRLYTLIASTEDNRWPYVKEQFYAVAQSLHIS